MYVACCKSMAKRRTNARKTRIQATINAKPCYFCVVKKMRSKKRESPYNNWIEEKVLFFYCQNVIEFIYHHVVKGTYISLNGMSELISFSLFLSLYLQLIILDESCIENIYIYINILRKELRICIFNGISIFQHM